MPVITSILRNAAKLSAMALLMLGSSSAAPQSSQLQLAYLASFDGGSLAPSLDLLGVGPMVTGDTQVAGSNPTWMPLDGEVVVQISRPATAPSSVATEVVATPVSFGQGTVFEEEATFISPVGPHEAGDTWAVGLPARTGGNNDLATDTRVVATLQVAGTHLRLNAVGAKGGSTFVNLPDDVYSAIFSQSNPQPFTLGLLINRVTGAARVSLVVGDGTFSRDVSFQAFQANTGPVISALSPGIAIAQGTGITASVHVREFRILVPTNLTVNSSATCSANWGPNCRAVPKPH